MSIDPRHYHQPSWRKPAGMFAILGLILGWAVLVGSLSPLIGQLPMWGQVPAKRAAKCSTAARSQGLPASRRRSPAAICSQNLTPMTGPRAKQKHGSVLKV